MYTLVFVYFPKTIDLTFVSDLQLTKIFFTTRNSVVGCSLFQAMHWFSMFGKYKSSLFQCAIENDGVCFLKKVTINLVKKSSRREYDKTVLNFRNLWNYETRAYGSNTNASAWKKKSCRILSLENKSKPVAL